MIGFPPRLWMTDRRRIVFLDFDGVVMTAASHRAARWTSREDPDWLTRVSFDRLDPALVANVSTLCERACADIVLSTSWRGTDERARAQLERALRMRGLAPGVDIIGQTPILGTIRGAEIERWLGEHRPGCSADELVVLDDDGDLAPFLHRWVRSTFERGFGEAELLAALRLFEVAP